MVRETAAQRRSRMSALLADFDARSRELRKLEKILDGMKEQLRQEKPGTYGEWTLSEGTPREIVDQNAVKTFYAAQGEPLPTKMTAAPMIVRPVTK